MSKESSLGKRMPKMFGKNGILYAQDGGYRWYPRAMLVVYSLMLLFGASGIVWCIASDGSGDLPGQADFVSRCLAPAAPILSNIWLDIALAAIGILGMLVAPRTQDGRRHAPLRDDVVVPKIGLRGSVKKAKEASEKLSLLSRKERLFKQYCDIYTLFERVFYIEQSRCGREEWDAMSKQLMEMYDAVSFRKRNRELPSSTDIHAALTMGDELLDIEIANMEKVKDDVDKLTRMWESKVGLDGTRVLFPARASANTDRDQCLEKIGTGLGMDYRIEAYYDKKIPVDDLVF